MKPALLLCAPWLLQAAEPPGLDGARALVQAFYADHFRGDRTFTPASVKAKSRFLAPDLQRACLAKLAEDAARGADVAPDVEGDPFTDSQEGPTAFRLGRIHSTTGGARLAVTFTWQDGASPRTLTVVLKNLQAGWRIDDLRYAEDRSLRQLLKPSGSRPE